MSLLAIELAGPTTRTRADLADDVAVEQLVTSMVTLVGDGSPAEGTWHAYVPEGRRIPPHNTLAQAGVPSGSTIYVTRATHAIDPDIPDPAETSLDDLTPSQRTSAAIPERVGLRRRFGDTVRALIGTRSTRAMLDGSAIDRAVDMWRWGDHRRRLEWVIGRPRLRRTVTIGLAGQTDLATSARTSVALAEALAAARTDRVVLIDGDPVRAGVTRLMTRGRQTISTVADGTDVLDARFGTDAVTVLGCDLTGTDIPDVDTYRRALDRIRPSAGVVVVDCGPVGSSRLTDLCDQMVLVTDAPFDGRIRRIYRNRATLIAAVPRPGSDLGAIEESLPTAAGMVAMADDLSGHELATMLVDGWIRLGATGEITNR